MNNTITNKMTTSEIQKWLNSKKSLRLDTVNTSDEKSFTHTVNFSDGSVYKWVRTYDRCSIVFNAFQQDVTCYYINGELVHTQID